MKLVELLARDLAEWADTTVCYVQDRDGTAWPCKITPKFDGTQWGADNFIDQREQAEMIEAELASDYAAAIVTNTQWQAERDRQKGGEWKRHRGGKCPVPAGTKVITRYRGGAISDWCMTRDASTGISTLDTIWSHSGCSTDIMAYKIEPQAEEVPMIADGDTREYKGPFPCSPIGEAVNALEWDIEFPSGVFHLEAQVDQIDGPIKWRDTIIHCQAIIEDCEREIQRNVDLLDAEGLMMQTDSKKAMQHYALDVLPFEDWKVGDIVASITNYGNQFSVDSEYEIESVEGRRIEITADDCGEKNGWGVDNFRFIRRP